MGERCSRTGKVCYTERDAGEMLNRTRDKRYIKRKHLNSKNAPRRKYRCEFCGWWHLTHQPFYKNNRQKLWGET